MASIATEPNGRRRILFIDGDGSRKTIRLGKVSQRSAQTVKVRIEDIIGAKLAGNAPSDETSRWMANLDDDLHERLARVGLVKPRGKATIGGFTRELIDGRADIKPATKVNLERARTYLLEYFDANKPMRDFTAGDAEDFQQHLLRSGRAENTVRRALGRARQFFTAAIKRGLLVANPFADISANVGANMERFYFLSREDAALVLAACPDDEWRVIFALCRYGGLRCPSEVLALKWGDVDWERGRIRVPSPKTARHGKASRTIPLFPELRPILLAAFDAAEDGAEFVVNRYRDASVNMRTQLCRIIRKAGLEPWPKLFQNLRSTRETELAETYPMHVVCNWIGNSQPVAARHYLQLTDDHFRRASAETQAGTNETPKVAQNPAQQVRASTRKAMNSPSGDHAKTPEKSGVRNTSHGNAQTRKTHQVPCVGLEPTTR